MYQMVYTTPSASPLRAARATSVLDFGGHLVMTYMSTILPSIPGHGRPELGGGKRTGAVGFRREQGIYRDGFAYYKDFWEYVILPLNTWTQKADFGGKTRRRSVFRSGTRGYIGTALYGPSHYKDFWEYDPALNTWTRKAELGGGKRTGAVGFSIGNKGYIGTGFAYYKDFWEYDPALNTWTQKADFGGGERWDAVGFSIGDKGYIGTGGSSVEKDFWEYNPGP